MEKLFQSGTTDFNNFFRIACRLISRNKIYGLKFFVEGPCDSRVHVLLNATGMFTRFQTITVNQ